MRRAMFAWARRLDGPRTRRWFVVLLLAGCCLTLGCRRKSPSDPRLEEAYRLLQSDPNAALEALEQARNPAAPEVVLARGLALEKLRRYAEAEHVLAPICEGQSEAVCWLALGQARVALGKLEDARAAIDHVTARDPTTLPVVLLEAFLAHDEARAQRSIAHLRKWSEHARRQQPPSPIPAEFYLAETALYRQLKLRAEFDAAKEQATKAQLSHWRTGLGLVELAIKTGRPDLAVELLRKVEDGRPSDDARRQVAKLAHRLGDHRLAGGILETLPGQDAELVTLRAEHAFVTGKPEAVARLRQALGETSAPAERSRLRLLLAEASLRTGQLGEARAAAEQALETDPTGAALLLIARVDLAEDKPQAALTRLAPVVQGPRPTSPARELAARAHLKLGESGEARRLLDAVLADHPGQPHAARLRIALELDGGHRAEALRVAQELVRRAPEDVELRLLLADVVQKTEGPSAAARSLEQSARALPGSARLWLGWVHALEGGRAESKALAALEEAHGKLPGDGAITAALAAKLARAGRGERAALLYQELLQRAGDDPIALNNLAVIYTDDLGHPERAVPLAERAYALSQEAPIADTLGWALYRRGAPSDLERARELLESIRSSLSSPTALYHLGAVLLATGATEEGRRLLAQALAAGEEFPGADHAQTLLKGQKPAPPTGR